MKAIIQLPAENQQSNRKHGNKHQNNNNNNFYTPDPKADQYNHNSDNSPLPWTVKESKNGKNFYENYARENDRRKKEGKDSKYIKTGSSVYHR